MSKILRVGVAGLGTVGSAVVRLCEEKSQKLARACKCPIRVVAVSARNRARAAARGIRFDSIVWYDNPEELASSTDIDVFVELIGGEEGTAFSCIKTALQAGHHVVTANKALLARHGVFFAKLAENKGVSLSFEAAVAGGIPVIKALRESLAGNTVSRVYGILNGTCNYILTRMEEEGLSFEACLKTAKNLGYAEADPTFDIEGYDTAHKLTLLASLAFGSIVSPNDVSIEGIQNISPADIQAANELGYRIKLLGVAAKTEHGIEQWVHPTMVPVSSVIAQVPGIMNAIVIESDLLGELLFSGAGAGGLATASAIIGDITDIAAHYSSPDKPVFSIPAEDLKTYKRAALHGHKGGYFIRFNVYDRAGVLASLAKHMAENDISLESIVQRPISEIRDQERKIIALVTHKTTETAILKVLDAISREGILVSKPQMIRIERSS